MAVPRNRMSNSKKNMRRSHHARKASTMSRCQNCGASKLPHRLCASCGTYRGRQVVAQEEGQE